MDIKKLVLCLCILCILQIIALFFSPTQTNQSTNKTQCTAHKCSGGIDNLSDPSYNMKEIAKQSILLEDHLIHVNKRCRDCIAKHFIFCESLATEAIQLAGSDVHKYPLLEEAARFYKNKFEEWLDNQSDDSKILRIADEVRDLRKQIVLIYFLKDQQ